jgi:sortase (surface protein transpeptidase)
MFNVPVISVGQTVTPDGAMITVPEYDVGWYVYSTGVGEIGNIILVGHNPGIFTPILNVKVGDTITLNTVHKYTVKRVLIVEDVGQPIEVRKKNLQYIQQSDDARLTLITCIGTKRLIITGWLNQ